MFMLHEENTTLTWFDWNGKFEIFKDHKDVMQIRYHERQLQ